jgi:nitrite reductase/ring-hydroxylating ferredoxin subunit
MTSVAPDLEAAPSGWRPGFSEYVLAGSVLLMLAGAVVAVLLYLLPPQPLQLEELQPAYRVAPEASFPVNGSRVVNWGDQVILVVRLGQQSYAAVQGTAPTDGCILNWNPTSLRVVSPCTHLVYDLRGNVVRGLSTVPLQRYPVFIRDGVVYVAKP